MGRAVPLPTLRPGDIIVHDNLRRRKGQSDRRAIRHVGAHLLFLPPHSPDHSPIEMMFAKLETPLRKKDEQSIAAVRHRISDPLGRCSPEKCANYLRRVGYAPT